MDSLTQIVLGGAVGEAVLGKKVGNKAILWGAIAGTIPDLDTIPGQFMDTVSRLEIHRGFSHSILFAILISPILGVLVQRLYRKKREADWWGWTLLFFWAIFTHPLLDIFTTWGTQLFWPLDWRIAIQSIFVIDPIYTLPFIVLLASAMFFNRKKPLRAKLNKWGLIISSSYLLITVGIKIYIDSVFEKALSQQEQPYVRYETRPTPFNTVLWTANVETENEFLIGYYSLMDEDKNIQFFHFPKNEELIQEYRNNPDIEKLIFLSKGYYTLTKTPEGLEMNDLRFGLTEGFDQGKGAFVFVYTIQDKNGELLIKQKPNSFEGIGDVMKKLYARMKGIKTF